MLYSVIEQTYGLGLHSKRHPNASLCECLRVRVRVREQIRVNLCMCEFTCAYMHRYVPLYIVCIYEACGRMCDLNLRVFIKEQPQQEE